MKFRYDVVAKIPNWVDTALSCIKWIVLEALSRVGLMKSPATENSPDSSAALDSTYFLLLDGFCPRSVPVRDLIRFIKMNLPVISHSSFLGTGGETAAEGVCTVCMEGISGEEKIRELCNCRHVFHRECLDRWVDEGRLSCPLCRSNLFPDKLGLAQLRDGCSSTTTSTDHFNSDHFHDFDHHPSSAGDVS